MVALSHKMAAYCQRVALQSLDDEVTHHTTYMFIHCSLLQYTSNTLTIKHVHSGAVGIEDSCYPHIHTILCKTHDHNTRIRPPTIFTDLYRFTCSVFFCYTCSTCFYYQLNLIQHFICSQPVLLVQHTSSVCYQF